MIDHFEWRGKLNRANGVFGEMDFHSNGDTRATTKQDTFRFLLEFFFPFEQVEFGGVRLELGQFLSKMHLLIIQMELKVCFAFPGTQKELGALIEDGTISP